MAAHAASALSALSRWAAPPLESLLAALLPPRCGLCDDPLAARSRYGLCALCLEHVAANDGARCALCDNPAEGSLCARCAADIPPFTGVVAPFLYGGSIADMIARIKFHRREDLAAGLGRLLADDARVQRAARGADAIVPVPLGWQRRRTRGFNQSAVIARVLGRELGVRVVYALERRRETRPQSDLPLPERQSNVAGSFTARRVTSGRCILVDDVVTSAETARHAALALRAGGAREVMVVSAARTPLSQPIA